MALAGGITLILAPDGHIICSKGQMLSKEGHCKTFDASADGYVRGEGCGIIVLKRLQDALADNDNILALIRGSAINQDGRSGGITVPSGIAQEAVIKKALTSAGVEPGQVGYVEAHGTGTKLGDPIEVQALASVYGKAHTKKSPLYIGSVKTNVGHLEAAAGIIGIIKAILILNHGEIPPSLFFSNPNPLIAWDQIPIEVVSSTIPWPSYRASRIAAVSSFGFSGTNSHIIVEAGPQIEPKRLANERPMHLLTLSAKNPGALSDLSGRYIDYFENHASVSIGDVCYTQNCGRPHHDHRLAVTGKAVEDLKQQLRNYLDHRASDNIIYGTQAPKQTPPYAFLFTGQGSQTTGMGRELFKTQPTFRRTLEQCNELLKPYLDIPLLSVLYPDSGDKVVQDLIHQYNSLHLFEVFPNQHQDFENYAQLS